MSIDDAIEILNPKTTDDVWQRTIAAYEDPVDGAAAYHRLRNEALELAWKALERWKRWEDDGR